MNTTATAWTIAENDNNHTTHYEVHAVGCAHLAKRTMRVLGGTYAGQTPAEVAAEFAAQNEGCRAKIANCAK